MGAAVSGTGGKRRGGAIALSLSCRSVCLPGSGAGEVLSGLGRPEQGRGSRAVRVRLGLRGQADGLGPPPSLREGCVMQEQFLRERLDAAESAPPPEKKVANRPNFRLNYKKIIRKY